MSRNATAAAPIAPTDQSELIAVDIPPAARHPKIRMITRSEIFPDPEQPRTEADAELRDSIARNGMLQPITVRQHPTEMVGWMIVDGERRWRATDGVMNDIPCIVRADMEGLSRRLATQLEANRGKPLTPLEEARAFGRLLDETGASAGELAELLGRAPSTVSERLGLLELGPWLPLIESGALVMSHAVKVLLPLRGIPNQFHEKIVTEVSPYLVNRHEDGDELRLEDVRKTIQRAAKPFLYPLTKTKAYGAKSAEFNTSKHDVECGCGVIRVALGYDKERTFCGDPTWWKPRHNAAMRAKHPVSKGDKTPASKAKQKALYLPPGSSALKATNGTTPAGVVPLTNSRGEWAPEASTEPFDPADLDLTQLKLVQWPGGGDGYPHVGTKDTRAIDAARAKWRAKFAGEERAAAEQVQRALVSLRKKYEISGVGVGALVALLVDKMYDEDLEHVVRAAIAVGLDVPKALRGSISYKQEDAVRKWAKGLLTPDAATLLTTYVALDADEVKLPADVVDELQGKAIANIKKRTIPWLTKPKEEKVPVPKKPAQKKAAAKASSRRPIGSFMKDMYPSPALVAVLGPSSAKGLPRTEVTKKLWSYIKRHKLQDTKNPRMIHADDALRAVFGGKDQVSMFEMTKMVNKHLAGTEKAAALIFTSTKRSTNLPLAKLSDQTAELPLVDERPERATTCVLCSCTDDRACAGGCSWLYTTDEGGKLRGVCSSCAGSVNHAMQIFKAAILAEDQPDTEEGRRAVLLLEGAKARRADLLAALDDDDEEDAGWTTHKDDSDSLWDSTDDADDLEETTT